MAVSSLPVITQEFRADVSSWCRAAETIAFHMSALAADLRALEADDAAQAEPAEGAGDGS